MVFLKLEFIQFFTLVNKTLVTDAFVILKKLDTGVENNINEFMTTILKIRS